MTEAEREQRIQEILAKEASTPSRWFWLSFVDPETGKFAGVAVVKARGVVSAAREAHRLGINPGGEICCAEGPEKSAAAERISGRLLNRAEAEAAAKIFGAEEALS